MNPVQKILIKLFVKEFYRENASVFIFFFVVMFGVVGILHNATFWSYHYMLIMGMLKNPGIFGFILLVWFLYARKCAAFVTGQMKTPEHAFLAILTRMEKRNCRNVFLLVQVLLYLPVLLYSLLILTAAIYHHYYYSVGIIVLFHFLICVLAAALYVHQLHHPESSQNILPTISMPGFIQRSYAFILFRYMFHYLKMIIVGIKVFTCGILYAMATNNTGDYYDLQFPFLFFCFGLLANGIVIHRLRHFEEMELSFHRGLPVSLATRFIQYLFVYLIYFIPELLTIIILTPEHLHNNDALTFALCGYGLLLILNSISLISYFEMKVYLRVVLLLFAIIYLFVASYLFTALYSFLLLSSTVLFFICYYRYQHSE